MIGIKQTTDRNCFAACIASILEVHSDEIPCLHSYGNYGDEWFRQWNADLLEKFGITIIEIAENAILEGVWFFTAGYWIASVPSLNLIGKNHCIVMFDDKVVFDPSPKKNYDVGMTTEQLDIKSYSLLRFCIY